MRVFRFAAALLMLVTSVHAADVPPAPSYPAVRPGVVLSFPADHGAHPAFRTEWWYITGWLDAPGGKQLGFQVTFFRMRPAADENNPSAFAPKHYNADIINFANTRGADKIIYAGYYPMGLSMERIMTDMPNVPFKDEVWPKFLYGNAARILGLA